MDEKCGVALLHDWMRNAAPNVAPLDNWMRSAAPNVLIAPSHKCHNWIRNAAILNFFKFFYRSRAVYNIPGTPWRYLFESFSLCLSISPVFKNPNYIISGLEIVNRNTLINAIIVDLSLVNSRLGKFPQMQNDNAQETEEDQCQTHVCNINC